MSGIENLRNIEEDVQQSRQMSSLEEQAYLKAPWYSKKAQMELAFESMFMQLYTTIVEKNQVIQEMIKELAELKKVTKTQQTVTNLGKKM